MSSDAWLRLPLTLLERAVSAGNGRPWIVPSAVSALERMATPQWHVLEVGAGASTLWWVKRVGKLISLETDESWFGELKAKTSSDLRLVDVADLAKEMELLPQSTFDLVMIDNSGDRMTPLAIAARLVKPGGWILLDNSDRYPQADGLLPGWAVRRFTGVPPKPLTAQETSFYQRPTVAPVTSKA